MLPKKNRLRKEKEFQAAYKGKRIGNKFFSLSYRFSKNKNFRIGIVVGKKVYSKSTDRNKLKRRVREILRKNFPKLKQNIDIVLISYPKVKDIGFKEIEKNIIDLLEKANLYNND